MRTLVFVSVLLLAGCVQAHEVFRAFDVPVIDGDPSDATWKRTAWRALSKPMIGDTPAPSDFGGRYKLVWTPQHLYLLAEITDDILIDAHADPLDQYWNDDMLEILIDEDASGGVHLEDFNAFAYHIALDNQVVDIAPALGEVQPRLFPNHVQARWKRDPTLKNQLYWEARIAVHGDDHVYGDDDASRVVLKAGKRMGFMVAYCDADSPNGREHFIGDVNVEAVNGDRNLAYINASVFGNITLVDQSQ